MSAVKRDIWPMLQNSFQRSNFDPGFLRLMYYLGRSFHEQGTEGTDTSKSVTNTEKRLSSPR